MVENNFSKVSRLFSHIVQSVLLVLLQGFFKKAGIQFKCNNVLRNEDKEYETLKVFLSKVNSFAYNLLDVFIGSVFLEISYFSTMESYTDHYLH